MFGEGTEEPELAGRRIGRKVTVTAEESARGGAARGSEGASDGSWRSEQEYEVFGGTLGAEGLHVCVKGAFRSWGSPVCVGSVLAGCLVSGASLSEHRGSCRSAGFCGTGPVSALGLCEETSDCPVPHLCAGSRMHVRSMCVDVGVCLYDGHARYLECIRVPYGCEDVSVCSGVPVESSVLVGPDVSRGPRAYRILYMCRRGCACGVPRACRGFSVGELAWAWGPSVWEGPLCAWFYYTCGRRGADLCEDSLRGIRVCAEGGC